MWVLGTASKIRVGGLACVLGLWPSSALAAWSNLELRFAPRHVYWFVEILCVGWAG